MSDELSAALEIERDRESQRFGFTPSLPQYDNVSSLIQVLDGVRKSDLTILLSEIRAKTGTPQETMDWSDPDFWIPIRLSNTSADLALRIWHGTEKQLNPRHMRGAYYLINRHHLMNEDSDGCYSLSERSRRFILQDDELICEIDHHEGLIKTLKIIATHEPARFSRLLEDWSEYVTTNSNYRAVSSIRHLLRNALQNLEARDLISRSGFAVSLTDHGREYADQAATPADEVQARKQTILRTIREYNQEQIELLRDRLMELDPYKFEFVAGELLEKMGYQDVNVTSQSGDHGVDVTAQIEFGITVISEVVQVKRRRKTLGRREIDQLRGALPYHGAIRGTLMTLGKFSSGCREAAIFPGAAPISLIDGDRLLQLLAEHRIGIRETEHGLLQLDEGYFAHVQIEEELLDDSLENVEVDTPLK